MKKQPMLAVFSFHRLQVHYVIKPISIAFLIASTRLETRSFVYILIISPYN